MGEIGAKKMDAVLRGMIQVCLELGIQMIAEGVETKEQADFRGNCHRLQTGEVIPSLEEVMDASERSWNYTDDPARLELIQNEE